MRKAFLAGRIILGLYFVYSAITPLLMVATYAGFAAAKGVPAPSLAVVVSHLLLLVSGLSILTGVRPAWGVAAGLLFFLPVTFMMHDFWSVPAGSQERVMQTVQFTKNLAIVGGLVSLLGVPKPWPYSLETRIRTRRTAAA